MKKEPTGNEMSVREFLIIALLGVLGIIASFAGLWTHMHD